MTYPAASLAVHEQAVLRDLSSLLAIRRQSSVDAVSGFSRIIGRIEAEDYGELARVALLRTALEVPAVESGRDFHWDIGALLRAQENHDILPDLKQYACIEAVAAAFGVESFGVDHLAWLVGRGLPVDVSSMGGPSLIIAALQEGRADLFRALWRNKPDPMLEDGSGNNLLSVCLMRPDMVKEGIWKDIVGRGALFLTPGSNGITPADTFLNLAASHGQALPSCMQEIRAAIQHEILSAQVPPSLPRVVMPRL